MPNINAFKRSWEDICVKDFPHFDSLQGPWNDLSLNKSEFFPYEFFLDKLDEIRPVV